MALSLTQVQTSLSAWQTAYDAVSKGSSFSMNGRTLTRTDADLCWSQIARLQRMENRLLQQASTSDGKSRISSLASFSSEQ